MKRQEIEAHPGYNLVVAKLFETHDGLRDITQRLDALASELAARPGPFKKPDPTWVRTAVMYNDALQRIMHAHHGTEDEIIFPYIVKRFAFDDAALTSEHEVLLVAMPGVQAALVALMSPDAGQEQAAAFATAAKGFREKLAAHLENEESSAVITLLKLTSSDIRDMFGGRL